MLNPLEAIEYDPPQVWLTSFYGFSPDTWGFLGFTQEAMRKSFLARSLPGALVVIYGAARSPRKEDRRVILGVQQQSHEIGHARDFTHPAVWNARAKDPSQSELWNFGVRATRAWRFTQESRIAVEAFAPETYKPGRGQVIGAQGMPLNPSEARRLLELELYEVPVFGGAPINRVMEGPASAVLAPSRPGPVSQQPFQSRESEGPKHIYVLQLEGDERHILGGPPNGDIVIKVGFSRSPQTRCDDHNRTLPQCAFRWRVLHSTSELGRKPFDCSDRAKAGEQAMIRTLCQTGVSLGGEFFRARPEAIKAALRDGVKAAEAWIRNG
ncbi:MAG: GIY-YIG nuclease family protein [Rhodobacter sp.]|nr:GIY-YIG nuclease family protein [Rhodobacter sp.]